MTNKNQIDVLVVVDAEAAASEKNLQENVYLIDTNKHCGSGQLGKAELVTRCNDGQLINWYVVGVSPSSDVKIVNFTGQMIDSGVCRPKRIDAAEPYWQGRVEARGTTGSQQYSIVIGIDDNPMSFDPFLMIS